MRTVYVNGDYLPEAEAKVSVFDRGFLFADGVYEVTSVLDGKLIDFPGHAARLARSLEALEIAAPMDTDALLEIHRELVARTGSPTGWSTCRSPAAPRRTAISPIPIRPSRPRWCCSRSRSPVSPTPPPRAKGCG
jgi:branched-subunit amino acid aminotransferase/4-amino-4-deoxychorismate lyase